MTSPTLTRFLGGQPVSVFVRLVFVSLVVGALLTWLDIRPRDLISGFLHFIQHIWDLGFDAIRYFADYLIAGAIIVIPVFIILRLMDTRPTR